jgi:hypothetical protein
MEKKRLYTIAWRQLYNNKVPAVVPADPIESALKSGNFAEAKAVIQQIKNKL